MLSRRVFLKWVPVTGVLLALPRLSGCGAGGAPDGSVPQSNGVVTLAFSQFQSLMFNDGSVVVDVNGGPTIAVVRVSSDSAASLSAVCTHEVCLVTYSSASRQLGCPCCGSAYGIQGDVEVGPATQALKTYNATVTATGISVIVG